jgi:predicted N-acyltransferase
MTAITASAWSVDAIRGAAAVDAEDWNRLARRGFHLHRWCVVAERCGWRPRHVGVAGPEGLRAVVPVYLMGPETSGTLHDSWLGPLAPLASKAGLALHPTLAVTAPFACASDPLGDIAAVPDRTMSAVFDVLEAQARRDGARAVVWPHVDERDERLIDMARRRGYAAVYVGASARLEVAWDSFDGYLASRSKSLRRTVRADLRAFVDAGLGMEEAEDFRPVAGAVDSLYRAAFRDRNGRAMQLDAAFFSLLAAEPTPGLWAQLTWRGAELVGASINLAAAGVVEGTFAALAAEHRGGPAYYNDLVYGPVRIACRLGATALDLGPTALVPKVLRGARLYRRLALVRGTSPLVQGILSGLGRLVAARTRHKERRRLAPLGAFRVLAG